MRSEGLLLRYLSSAYRALRQTVPDEVKTEELEQIIDWLGETVRQTDSSLLDEWEALTDPESVERASAAMAAGEPTPPARPITANDRNFTVMVRNAMFQKVRLASRGRAAELAQLEAAAAALTEPAGKISMRAPAWEAALDAYWDEYESMGAGPEARAPQLLMIDRDPGPSGIPGASSDGRRRWIVRQVIDDPEDDRDFAIVAEVDLDGSDQAGEPVIRTLAFGPGGFGD